MWEASSLRLHTATLNSQRGSPETFRDLDPSKVGFMVSTLKRIPGLAGIKLGVSEA